MSVVTVKITCPCCNSILVIDKITGDVLEHREPLVENPSGDRFADALRAQKDHSKKIKTLFEKSISEVKDKDADRQNLFEESLKKTREEGIGDYKPIRDIDLD